MKILFCANEFPAISETFVLNQITYMIRAGNDITIISNRPRNEHKTQDDFIKYSLGEHAYYTDFPDTKLERVKKLFGKLFRRNIKESFMLLKTLNFLKLKNDCVSLYTFYWGKTFLDIKDKEFDAVICHFGNNGSVMANLKKCNFFDVDIYTIFHGSDMTTLVEKNGDTCYDTLFELGTNMLPISNYWSKRLIELGCPKDKIIVQRLGINMDNDNLKKEVSRNKSKSGFAYTSIARLTEKRGWSIQ